MTFVSNAALMPDVPAPPHDPKHLRLDHRVGWSVQTAEGVEIGQTGLKLGAHPNAAQPLDGPEGSFGGLSLPSNVAISPDAAVLLLDRATGHLKRFDGCECAFRTIPHTGGLGEEARQFGDPRGIATCGELLLVADAGKNHIAVFSLYGYMLRAFWTPPMGVTSVPWQPVAVAARRGRVVVADRANGALHFFSGAGQWIGVAMGFGALNAVRFDRYGRVWVSADDSGAVTRVAWRSGATVGLETTRLALLDSAPDLPFPVGPSGILNLAQFCTSVGAHRWFDLNGAALPDTAGQVDPHHLAEGMITIGPLDSKLHRCVWDRIALDLEVPENTSVQVLGHCAEVPKTVDEIADLPDQEWSDTARATSRSVNSSQWDALLRCPPGRFLWLRFVLASDGESTPHIAGVDVDFPRVSLRRYLPAVYAEEPVSADFTDRFLAVFDRGFRDIECQIDTSHQNYDPLSSPAGSGPRDFLTWLASWIGVTLDRQLPLARRRAILKSAGKLFALRGTKTGLRATLALYLGIDEITCKCRAPCCGPCTKDAPPDWQPPRLILEHFSLRRWLFVGTGRLGDDAKLWGARIVNRSKLTGAVEENGAQLGVTRLDTTPDPLRDPFHVYAHRFSVFLPGWIARLPGRKRIIERLVRAESPAHTAAQIEWVEPRFRVGVQSMIGFDSVIGAYPQSRIELGTDHLGKASVLPAADGRATPRFGRDGQIGAGVL